MESHATIPYYIEMLTLGNHPHSAVLYHLHHLRCYEPTGTISSKNIVSTANLL